MAAALVAIKGFVHFLTDDLSYRGESPRHIPTILDVLEPRSPRN
ncbi:MAG: hypothetical protein ACOH1Y_01265 [Propionicimonas sp.]